jgi:hypothetical protein
MWLIQYKNNLHFQPTVKTEFGQVHSASRTQYLPPDTDSVTFKVPEHKKETVLGSLLNSEFVNREREEWEWRVASHCNIKQEWKKAKVNSYAKNVEHSVQASTWLTAEKIRQKC